MRASYRLAIADRGNVEEFATQVSTGRLVGRSHSLILVGSLVPPAVVTLVLEQRLLDIANTHLGLIATYMSMCIPITVFLMAGFIRLIPHELEEAARVAVAGQIRIFSRIVLPLLSPIIATATIMIVLFTWSGLFYPSFELGGGAGFTLPLSLLQIASAQLYQNNWNLVFAFIVIMSTPMVLVFKFAQSKIISGLTSGAVK